MPIETEEMEMAIRAAAAVAAGAVIYSSKGLLLAREVRQGAQRLWDHFTQKTCPRKELAAHLRGAPLPEHWPKKSEKAVYGNCPPEWAAAEEAERNSVYFLRTGQRVSEAVRERPEGCWYGPEEWIRDVAGNRADLQALCETPKPATAKKSAAAYEVIPGAKKKTKQRGKKKAEAEAAKTAEAAQAAEAEEAGEPAPEE